MPGGPTAGGEERGQRGAVAIRSESTPDTLSLPAFEAIVNDQTEMICRYRPDTTLVFVNDAFAAFYGETPTSMVGRKLITLFPEEERAAEFARLASFTPEHPVQWQEDWEPRGDGDVRWYEWTDRAFFDEHGRVVEFQSVGRDVHDRRRAELLLRAQNDVLTMVARGGPLDVALAAVARLVEDQVPGSRCAVMRADGPTRLVVAAAPSMPEDFRVLVPEVSIIDGAGTCGTAAARRATVISEEIASDPLWTGWVGLMESFGIRSAWSTPLVSADGTEALGTIAVYGPSPGAPDPGLVTLVESLAHLAEIAIERKRFEELLTHETLHDPLTNLPNRALLIDRIDWAIARTSRVPGHLAVLFCDLDGFKIVNDSLGHTIGDRLLCSFAERLQGVVRPGDTVARFGGDEFVVLCEELPEADSREQAIEIAQRILSAMSEPFVVDGAEAYLRASVGIALADGRGVATDDVLRDADAALHHAKELGKARWWVFDDVLRRRAVRQHETYTALHRALDRNEFLAFYQPVVDLASGRCAGAEVLLRWQHPERGLVLPYEFIPLAEQSDLVVRLGEVALVDAARRAAQWGAGHTEAFSLAVNLSARQLTQPDLALEVERILAETGARPEHISFEVTESVLMSDADRAIGVIDDLEALGIHLAIDDFGTGYSSLSYLKRFAVDRLKIDRSFVAGLGTDPEDQAIVAAVISMAQTLGLAVVAEGVEDETQLRELVRLGCDYAQGYFFGRPEPVGDEPPEWSDPSHRWFIPT